MAVTMSLYGRRTSVLEADGSRVTWTYDSISQVTSEWRTGTNPYRHTFTYDKCGNRTLKIEDGARTTLVYDACNQLLTSEDAGGITSYIYDGNGNQTVVQKPNGDRTTQGWDYGNRLIRTIQPTGGVTSMAYDADGLRLKKEDATGTKLFVWDDQNYLAETDAAGATETAFTTEPSTYGGLISHRKAGASTTYHFDALGSTRALTDASEAVLERYNYTAFGTLLGSPTLLTPFLWGGMVGYYWDAALATQYIRARSYQPTIARWISLDPIGFAGGDANLFRYVGNSPTSGSTGIRVRLSASAYGNWQVVVAPTALGHLRIAGVVRDRNGSFLAQNRGRIAIRGIDPLGMQESLGWGMVDWDELERKEICRELKKHGNVNKSFDWMFDYVQYEYGIDDTARRHLISTGCQGVVGCVIGDAVAQAVPKSRQWDCYASAPQAMAAAKNTPCKGKNMKGCPAKPHVVAYFWDDSAPCKTPWSSDPATGKIIWNDTTGMHCADSQVSTVHDFAVWEPRLGGWLGANYNEGTEKSCTHISSDFWPSADGPGNGARVFCVVCDSTRYNDTVPKPRPKDRQPSYFDHLPWK